MEAEADVIDDRSGKQGRNAGGRPQLVRGSQLVVQPQARVALPHGRHLGGSNARRPASYADAYVSPARTPNMAAPVSAGRGLERQTRAIADGCALRRLPAEGRGPSAAAAIRSCQEACGLPYRIMAAPNPEPGNDVSPS